MPIVITGKPLAHAGRILFAPIPRFQAVSEATAIVTPAPPSAAKAGTSNHGALAALVSNFFGQGWFVADVCVGHGRLRCGVRGEGDGGGAGGEADREQADSVTIIRSLNSSLGIRLRVRP